MGPPRSRHSGDSARARRCPRPMPRIPAFRRSALSVRFIFLAISGRGVRAFECLLSSRTSSLVHGVRWAEVFIFGTDSCSGKGSRLRTTPVARLTHASKRGPRLGVQHGRVNFPVNVMKGLSRRPSGLRTTTSTPAWARAKDRLAVTAFRYVRCAHIAVVCRRRGERLKQS